MAEGIHGDLSQQKRDSVIRQFREGTIDILVATDGQLVVLIFPAYLMYITMICLKILKATHTA